MGMEILDMERFMSHIDELDQYIEQFSSDDQQALILHWLDQHTYATM